LFSTRLDLNERIIADALIEHLRGAIRSSGSITGNTEHSRNGAAFRERNVRIADNTLPTGVVPSSNMADPLSNSAFRQLPPGVPNLLRLVSAPPRLIAHLVLVHDVASRLVELLSQAFPNVALDGVLFGAATHDLGKAHYIAELVRPGKEHERRGVDLLLAMGISQDRARFAYTHGNWDTVQNVTLEDLLVALADNCWKGKREDALETKTVNLLSAVSGKPAWDCYAELDKILGALAADADARLDWQREFGTECAGNPE
jgi:hypothetical protein